MEIPERVDVVVVGGGIVGAASAYQLARRGCTVALLEKGEIAGEQSGRNWGFIRQQGRDPDELPLMMVANKLWRAVPKELGIDIEWVQGGNLRLAEDAVTAASYEAWAKMGAELGLGTRVLALREIQNMLPGITRQWLVGIYTPSDGHADPVKATSAVAEGARRAGAAVITGCTVTRITTCGGAVDGVETDRGPVRAPVVICAAGIWSQKLLRTVRLNLPLRVVRGTVALTTPTAPLTRACVWSQHLAFKQTASGSLLISAGGVADVDVTVDTFRNLRMFLPMFIRNRSRFRIHIGRRLMHSIAHRGDGGYTAPPPEPNPKDVDRGLRRLHEYFPTLRDLGIGRTWAGYIDGTPDALPVVDAPAAPRGLIIATGLSGHGFGLGPAIGVAVADLVVKGSSDFDLHPMRFARFAEGQLGHPKNLL